MAALPGSPVAAADGATLAVHRSCSIAATDPPILAVTRAGALVTINPTTLRVESTLTRSALRGGGVAVEPSVDLAFVTAPGRDGRPAIWSVPLAACRSAPTVVARDAELPSVSPDGGYLGYVTLNGRGQQTGVAVEPISTSGKRAGPAQHFRAATVPPRLPIKAIAVAPRDAALAVSGGFVDTYLGPRPTVGTLTPASASSLASLVPVFDAEGISIPPPANGKPQSLPRDWQSSPVYLPNGEFLVGDGSQNVSMPFTDNSPGEQGGGIRTIVRDAGPISALAAGSGGSLAWVSTNGTLHFESDAVNLPFGPAAETPPAPGGTIRQVAGRYESVAWTGGPETAASTAPPPTFRMVSSLPNVVGLLEPAAAQVMKQLGLPVFVASTQPDANVPADTVLSQNPGAGTAIACQCAIALTVSGPPASPTGELTGRP